MTTTGLSGTLLAFLAKWITVLVFTGSLVVELSSAQNVTDAKDLRTQLFVTDAYDYRVRPVSNQSQHIDIYMSFTLLSLNELSEMEETIKTTAYLTLTWTDSELQWTPANYGGITEMFWPQDDIWRPIVTLTNSNVEHEPLGHKELYVYNDYQGTVTWSPFQLFISTCSMDVTFFPFDSQTCTLTFKAWTYRKSEIKFKGTTNTMDMSEYEPNPVWALQDTSWSIQEDSTDSYISFQIQLRRHASYVMLNVFIPVFLLTVLNVCVFLLPCDSGEKNSYAVTVFLSFAVFLTMMSGILPENADAVALFSVYLLILTFQSTVITVLALLFSRFITLDKTQVPIPPYLLTLSNLVKVRACCCRSFKRSDNKVNHVDKTDQVEDNTSKLKLSQRENFVVTRDNVTWVSVVNGLDAFCFVVFSVFSFLITFLFLVIASTAS